MNCMLNNGTAYFVIAFFMHFLYNIIISTFTDDNNNSKPYSSLFAIIYHLLLSLLLPARSKRSLFILHYYEQVEITSL